MIYSTEMSAFAMTTFKNRYAFTPEETWPELAHRLASTVLGALWDVPKGLIADVERIIRERKFIPGGRYLHSVGRPFHQVQNCLLLRAEDSREGWADHLGKVTMASMTGAGLGAVYSDLREKGAYLSRTGGVSSGPLALMQATNEVGRAAMQGGHRRAALWAGLHWNHPDALAFVAMKNWSADIRALKAKDFSFPAMMDHTNISVILDDAFFAAIKKKDPTAEAVYMAVIRSMLETGEPGFSIDTGANTGENLRNACTEVTSRDDSDICNLGSINMARIDSLAEMREVTELATVFLLAGTVYSDVPYDKVSMVRQKNRRLGLGLMGLHEWLLKRGKKYGPDHELASYLGVYEAVSTSSALAWSQSMGMSCPVKTRAVAPTGTIGIVAETTTGVEPVFCASMKRRYLDKGTWKYQYVLDPTAKRLVESGIAPETIEDAYSIDPERRLTFQCWLQSFVDHAISSTLNLPAWGSPKNSALTVDRYASTLLNYLPDLRGLTVYPDGARDGQPLTPVAWSEAAAQVGEVFTEQGDVCDLRGGGSCGS